MTPEGVEEEIALIKKVSESDQEEIIALLQLIARLLAHR